MKTKMDLFCQFFYDSLIYKLGHIPDELYQIIWTKLCG